METHTATPIAGKATPKQAVAKGTNQIMYINKNVFSNYIL